MVLGTDLTGKMAVVTGAGGILCGMFARTLARAGAAVALLDINLEAAEETARDIREAGGTAADYGVDVMDKEMLESVHARVLAQLGPCDILINGAGGNRPGPIRLRNILRWGISKPMWLRSLIWSIRAYRACWI